MTDEIVGKNEQDINCKKKRHAPSPACDKTDLARDVFSFLSPLATPQLMPRLSADGI